MNSQNPDVNKQKLTLLEVLTLQDLTPEERAAEAAARDEAVKRAFKYFTGVLVLTALVGGATGGNHEDDTPHPQPAVEAPGPLHNEQVNDEATPDGSGATTGGSQVMRLNSENEGTVTGDPVAVILESIISTLR